MAPLGGKIRQWVPRAGLLGSLAGIALALIAFVPLWTHIAAVPVVGLLSLTVILVALVAQRALPGRIPGALAAVVVGVLVYCRGQLSRPAAGLADRPAAGQPRGRRLAGAGVAARLLRGISLWWQRVGLQALAASADHAAVRPGHDRRRHRLHGERRGGRRRVRHAHHPPDRRAGFGGGRRCAAA